MCIPCRQGHRPEPQPQERNPGSLTASSGEMGAGRAHVRIRRPLDGPSARLLPLWSGLTCRKFPTYQSGWTLPTRGPCRTGKSVRRRIFRAPPGGPTFAASRVMAGGACRPGSRTEAHLRCNHHPMTQLTAPWPAPEPRERLTWVRGDEAPRACRRPRRPRRLIEASRRDAEARREPLSVPPRLCVR